MTKQKILIADDEAQIREILRIYFEKEDFDVIEANEAFAAQSVAVGKDLHFDLSKLNVNGG